MRRTFLSFFVLFFNKPILFQVPLGINKKVKEIKSAVHNL